MTIGLSLWNLAIRELTALKQEKQTHTLFRQGQGHGEKLPGDIFEHIFQFYTQFYLKIYKLFIHSFQCLKSEE